MPPSRQARRQRSTDPLTDPLTDPQILRDHRVSLPPSEPPTGLEPDPLSGLLPLGGQPATLRVPHSTGIPQGPPALPLPDNTPKRSVID
jgi:hypothetical protein